MEDTANVVFHSGQYFSGWNYSDPNHFYKSVFHYCFLRDNLNNKIKQEFDFQYQ